jgi:menaquinone-dependent protoporphyrinogen IX oxidase
MKCLVVFDTSYGNTQKIAETIAQTLKGAAVDVDLADVHHAKPDATNYEFLVLGSPTKFGTMSFAVKRFLGRIKGEWAGKAFAAFDTENPENMAKAEWSAAEKIAEKLKEKGMVQALPVLKAAVQDKKGPLIDGEIERATGYAKELAGKLKPEKP